MQWWKMNQRIYDIHLIDFLFLYVRMHTINTIMMITINIIKSLNLHYE